MRTESPTTQLGKRATGMVTVISHRATLFAHSKVPDTNQDHAPVHRWSRTASVCPIRNGNLGCPAPSPFALTLPTTLPHDPTLYSQLKLNDTSSMGDGWVALFMDSVGATGFASASLNKRIVGRQRARPMWFLSSIVHAGLRCTAWLRGAAWHKEACGKRSDCAHLATESRPSKYCRRMIVHESGGGEKSTTESRSDTEKMSALGSVSSVVQSDARPSSDSESLPSLTVWSESRFAGNARHVEHQLRVPAASRDSHPRNQCLRLLSSIECTNRDSVDVWQLFELLSWRVEKIILGADSSQAVSICLDNRSRQMPLDNNGMRR